MNIKKIVSSMLTATVLATTIVMPSYAEDSFSTAKEFLSDVLDVSTAEVESQTLTTAKETVLNSISISGDEVFYDGVSIGYWYSDEPSKLYADTGKTSTVIAPDTEGYTVSPSLLYDMLYDLNELLEDNYVPSTADWSKIIGKYDVTLGGVTIPADQWVELSNYGSSVDITDVNPINLSTLSGIDGSNITAAFDSDNYIGIAAYAIDNNGKLYIQQGIAYVSLHLDWSRRNWGYGNTTLDGKYKMIQRVGTNEVSTATYPFIKAGVVADTMDLYGAVFITDAMHSTVYSICVNNATYANAAKLVCVEDPSTYNTANIDELKEYGLFYIKGSQFGVNDVNTAIAAHRALLNSYSTSKLVKGNQKLTRRLSALASLLPTDTVTVKSTGWTVNGHDNSIDNYITDQSLNNAGDTADIAAVADIDALKFHVVVPTSLPIYIDDANITYVADNADVVNKSGAAVKITDVEIVPKQDSGWTMVDGTPTKELEGHEFNFTTTIEKDKVLAVSEVYPFQYAAKLSPTAEASNSLELASVLVTVDWAST